VPLPNQKGTCCVKVFDWILISIGAQFILIWILIWS
jgi:hypothetical protein